MAPVVSDSDQVYGLGIVGHGAKRPEMLVFSVKREYHSNNDLGRNFDVSDDDFRDLSLWEASLSAKTMAARRLKAAIKKERVEAGEAERDVTDHAVVRYLERCEGFDIEATRAKMRVLASEAQPSKDGDHHWHPSGVILILGDDGQIVTVLSGDQIEKWVGRKLADGTRAKLAEPETT